ncbi:hypothetical protein [Deinococcus cellulosilyticus]|uniref:Uncharacterized protein n=1 Tax=Deinococcus cellulosilyticus (strain DSM 18568 / NBRC 106333 / KACC 11606 / 5516J-15) TaxID=1223518 RepID=A0A511MZ94_DEIC1|nr:hypothetical protein [Deinococcus cellulosilyticus]GEM45446.1 hypothetical protein DC3_10810 [Deinococcus cellulosilyticus NBRC 106333 = KACC 11606]
MDFSRILEFFSGRRFWIIFVSIIALIAIFSAFDLKAASCQLIYRSIDASLRSSYCTPVYRLTPQWQKVDDQTLKFEGEIQPDNLSEFKRFFTPAIKKVVVNSIKGDYQAAFQIGKLLKAQNVTVQVDGFCMSACANYWFLAGQRKILDGGVVGFQGNYNAVIADMTDAQIRENLEKEFKSTTGTRGTPEQLETAYKRFMQMVKEEAAFFKSQGISQKLFEYSQKKDKGAGDGKTYIFLIPSRKQLEQYGVKGIEGEQSESGRKILAATGPSFYKE